MTKETTATRLRNLRLQKEVSQSDVARYLGIERASYSAYESGVSRPVRYMDKLALYFHVSTDYLLCLSDNPQPKKQGLNEVGMGFIPGLNTTITGSSPENKGSNT